MDLVHLLQLEMLRRVSRNEFVGTDLDRRVV